MAEEESGAPGVSARLRAVQVARGIGHRCVVIAEKSGPPGPLGGSSHEEGRVQILANVIVAHFCRLAPARRVRFSIT